MASTIRLPDNIVFDKSEIDVLVVEDTYTQALVMQDMLMRDGYKVTIARSGAQALENLRKKKSSMVLTDVNMPDIDGYQLCAQIKADPALNHIPVVLLASFAEQKDILKILDCGADNMLFKQFDEGLLLSRLASILKTYAMRRAASVSEPLSSDGGKHLPVHYNSASYSLSPDLAKVTDLLLSAFCVGVFMGQERTEDEYAQVVD